MNPLPHRAVLHFAVLAAMAFSAAMPTARSQEPSAELDLQGILPGFIPTGITDTDFAELNGNWADWANTTGTLVVDFYSSEDPAVFGRKATLDQLRARVATMELALEDSRYAGIHLPLADFHNRLAPRVAVLEALLDTLNLDVAALGQAHSQAALKTLAADARALDAHFRSIPKGDAWLPYLKVPEIIAAAESASAPADLTTLLDSVAAKLAGRTALDEAQRNFLSAEPVLAFEDSIATARASLVARNPDEYRSQLREKAAALVLAIEEYKERPLSVYTRTIRAAYDDIRRMSPDGGDRLTDAMRRYFLNYNTRAMVDEALVQTLFNESRMESGFINEMANSARVTGCQWTDTHAGIDLKPSVDGARFDLWMRGNVRAQMKGETHMATVYLSGSHHFDGRKEVFFNGDHFYTNPARVSVSARTTPTGARTSFSPIPILGRISENIAVNEARKQVPEANQRTRQRIYQEAKPRFDQEAARNFYEAELEIERKINGPLREQGLYPDATQFTSSEIDVMARTRVMESGELGGAATFPIPIYPGHGILLQFHESLLNNAAQRFELEGKTFTPEELKAYLTGRLEKLTGRSIDLNKILPSEEDDAETTNERIETVTFAAEDAIRVQLEGGRIKLYLRVGFDIEGRDPIAPQSISMELYPTLVGDKVHIEPGSTIGVDAIGPVPPGEVAAQITRANIMRSKMQDLFEPTDLNAVTTQQLQKKTLTLRLTDLKVRGGWVSAVLTDGVSQPYRSYASVEATRESHVVLENQAVQDRTLEGASPGRTTQVGEIPGVIGR
ncbi:MAG: hypothetical protein KF861_10530 [Planctomycetaceae bacterium]|nr:hypothetical protein [Planctomycetaceae bacterium]